MSGHTRTGLRVAETKGDANDSRHAADARLIAAAPDLLAALKACCSDLDDVCFADGSNPSPTMMVARAAIAQAEGKA